MFEVTLARAGLSHMSGGIAHPWNEVVSKFRSASGKYPSLDEFVRAEITQRVKTKIGADTRSWDEGGRSLI
jgi:hypothetical protein